MDTFSLHQRCPPISIYSSYIWWEHGGTHVSPWHMYLTGRYLVLFLLSYFLLKMVSVMNELHCHRKVLYTWQKFSNDYDMIQLQNQQFTNNTLHERNCSTELLVFSKGVLKNFANFTGKHLCRVKCEPKSLIYPCRLHLRYKRDSCTQLLLVSSAEFLRIPFFRALPLGEYFWLYIRYFYLKKYMKVSFLLTVFYRKKPSGSKTGTS